MKFIKNILVAVAFLGAITNVINAQTPIVPHLTNKSIKVEMPKYTTVSPFICDNLIQMESDNSLAYINLKGEYVYGFDLKMHTVGGGLGAARGTGLFDCAAAVKVPQEGSSYPTQHTILCQKGRMLQLDKTYSQISDFCDGITAAVKQGDAYGRTNYYVYLNAAGKEVLPTLHRKIECTSFGLKLQVAPLRDGMRAFFDATLELWGYADKNGKVIIQPKYCEAMPFSEGLAAVCLQDGKYGAKKWGFIDKTGKEVITCNYKLQPGSFSDGFAVLYTGEDSWDSKAVFIDKTGKISSPEYNACNSFFGGFAYVSNKYGKAMVVDKNFNVVKELDFPTDLLTNDASRISAKNPFGLEFINGLAAAGYFAENPNGSLYTNDGNILFERKDRNTIYNFYDRKYALCCYKIDGKETFGFINKEGEFVIYFEEKSDFNYTTPKPQNAACELCTTTTVTEIPCDICNKQSVCYDEYNCCDECNPKSKCYDICNKKSKCYDEYECCDECNPKSKCYDEYECCDKTNPKSRCYENIPCATFDCDTFILLPPQNPKNPKLTSDMVLNYRLFSTEITLDKVATYLQMMNDKNEEKPQFTSYKIPATVFIAISDRCIVPTPYGEKAHGLIWVVVESGMPGRPENDFASYWSAPYTIFSLTSNEIGYGAGLLFGVERNYDTRGISAQSSKAGQWISSFKKLVTDPLSLFIDDELIEDPAILQKANYKIKDEGNLLLTSSTLPIFNNLLLTPYFPDAPITIYKGSLGYVLNKSGRETDREGASKVGPEFDKALQKKYSELKKKIEIINH